MQELAAASGVPAELRCGALRNPNHAIGLDASAAQGRMCVYGGSINRMQCCNHEAEPYSLD